MDGCVYVKKDKFTNSIMDLYSSDLLSVRPEKQDSITEVIIQKSRLLITAHNHS